MNKKELKTNNETKVLEEIKKEEWDKYSHKDYALERAIKKLKSWQKLLKKGGENG